MTSKKILIHCDNIIRAKFFGHLVDQLGLSERAQYITHDHYTYIWLKQKKYICLFISALNTLPRNIPKNIISSTFDKSLCSKTGYLNKSAARGIYVSINRILSEVQPDVYWCWNGGKFIDLLIIEYSEHKKILVKCFETANIFGKIIVDDNGVNARSTLFKVIQIQKNLTGYQPLENPILGIKERLSETKALSPSIPQSKLPISTVFSKVLETFLFWERQPKFYLTVLDRLVGYIVKPVVRTYYKKRLTNRYHYFPMQVSDDTQVLFNSEVDVFAALKTTALKHPQQVIITNFHPAEHRISAIMKLIWIARQTPNIQVSSYGSWQILQRSHNVTTLNSTVGLEALILGIPVKFMGVSLIDFLAVSPQLIAHYVDDYCLSRDALTLDILTLPRRYPWLN